MNHIIYHYCSLEAFYSIIKTKSFWLFSLSSSNDRKELTEAEKIIGEILDEGEYENLKRPNVPTHNEYYSLSCTKKRDNALHFCKYANNEKGVCFGINTMVFEKYLNETLPLDLYRDYLSFQKVIYMDGHEKDKIRKYLEYKLLCIDQPEKMKTNKLLIPLWHDISEQFKNEFRSQILTDVLSHFKPKSKIENYKDESEVRILFNRNQFETKKKNLKNNFDANDPIIKEFLRNSSGEALQIHDSKRFFAYLYDTLYKSANKLNLNSSPEFRVMSGVIRKYMELKMEDIWDDHPITEVILGPSCKTNIEEFNEFLESNKVSCKAVESEIRNRK